MTTTKQAAQLAKIHRNASVWEEYGCFHAGIQYESGRLVLGSGATAQEAIEAALAAHEG